MSSHLRSMLAGGLLVALGFVVGQQTHGPTQQAQAATTLPVQWSPLKSGNGALVTSSADGLTLHFWAPRGRDNEELWRRAAPVHVGSVRAR